MRNLLPENYKKKVSREYNIRILIVSMWMAFSVVCVLITLTLPSFFLVQAQSAALYERKSLIERTIVIRKKDVSLNEIENTKKQIEKIQEIQDKKNITDVMVSIKEVMPSDISVNDFYFLSGQPNEKEQKSRISIRGISQDRRTLTRFRDNLKKLKEIKDVELPTSQLAKSANIPFLIEIEGDF